MDYVAGVFGVACCVWYANGMSQSLGLTNREVINMSTTTETTLDATQTFWDVVAIKDSIDGIIHTLESERNFPYENMMKVDLHNAKVELNKALEKLHILIQTP